MTGFLVLYALALFLVLTIALCMGAAAATLLKIYLTASALLALLLVARALFSKH